MRIYHFRKVQVINSDIDTVWSFFSCPGNLAAITPLSMKFEVIDVDDPVEMYDGQVIEYKVSPFPFLRVRWVSKIVGVVPYQFFADDQQRGPFAMWYHRHFFSVTPNGVEMTDQISYSIPMGPLGRIANALFVARRLRRIFEYRRQRIESIFPGRM